MIILFLLKSITISETDKYFNNKNTIVAETGNIISKNWVLSEVSVLNDSGNTKYYKSLVHNSSFNGEIIANLFSNLNSLNLYELHKLSDSYSKIGYSTKDINMHLNKIYSMPVFYLLMTILGLLIMMKFTFIKTKFFTIIVGVSVSVFVYYINYFSSLFGSNETIPILLSIWLPHLILFLICILGGLRINEK